MLEPPGAHLGPLLPSAPSSRRRLPPAHPITAAGGPSRLNSCCRSRPDLEDGGRRGNRGLQQVFLGSSGEVTLTRGRALMLRFRDRYPAPMERLARDVSECLTYLRVPAAHHRRIGNTHRLDRLAGEGRRRTKVSLGFPTERSWLSLLYATLISASRRWPEIPMTAAMVKRLDALQAHMAAAMEEAVA